MEDRIRDRGGRSYGKQKTKTEIRQAELSMSQDASMKKYTVDRSYSYRLYHHEYSQRHQAEIALAFPTT